MKPGMAPFYSSTGVFLLWCETKYILYARSADDPQKKIRYRIHPGVVLSYSTSKSLYFEIQVPHHHHNHYLFQIFAHF